MQKPEKPIIKKGHFVVRNVRGLHTRPSTEIVKCANRFKSEITLSYQGKEISANSLLDILILAVGKGAKVMIVAKGPDAPEAVKALQDLAKSQFHIEY